MALPEEIETQFAAIERSNEIGNKQRQAVMDSYLDSTEAVIGQMSSLAVAKAALGSDFRGDDE